ncbi:MAG: biliverdin-producing heme oxygenase [Acetobacteraceae bacterium]|nr:biliverdin-producing heme oxygenase [Acetobacteraceae bacterium]
MSPIPARLVLREATRAAHERLHGLPEFASLAAGTLDLAGYVALLSHLFGFHAPMEEAVADALGHTLDPHAWQRVHLLRADLATLGVHDPDPLPRVEPPFFGKPGALGVLYVIEGSTLGGRQLARQLNPLLDGTASRRFLLGGNEPGHLRWRTLCAMLDRVGADQACLDGMVAGAIGTFATFERWFADR